MGVRETIFEAFADAPYPGDENISAPTYDDEGTQEYFRGKSWRGHTATDLRHHSFSLSFFTADAFRYFLPAFMLAELDDPEETDVIGEHIAGDFTRSSFAEERMRNFTQTELRAIAAFFDECVRRYENFNHEYECAANEVRRFLRDT